MNNNHIGRPVCRKLNCHKEARTIGKKKKKRKYDKWIDEPKYRAHKVKLSGDPRFDSWQQSQELSGSNIPPPMLLSMRDNPGFFLGLPSGSGYVGIPLGSEEHIIVVGGSGSGKSSGVAMPTLKTWDGPICATDVKGELSDCYEELYQNGIVDRPHIVFDPMDVEGSGYDPFWWPARDSPENLYNNIWEITFAIIPTIPGEKEPFWIESEQAVLTAALLQYFKYGLSFSEAITAIVGQSVFTLCKKLEQSEYCQVRDLVKGTASSEDSKMIAGIDRGLRNKLTLFANDPYISHAFRGNREDAACFTWEDLDIYNIFLRIPADKIEQWGGAVNLMYSQLIRYFERRPEKYSSEGVNNIQTLLLMDEFARFGKLEMITAAMATLRSKNVNICLMIQSVAQLDRIYGEYERRVIFDNCGYLAILQANDPDTQKFLCERIGTHMRIQRSASEHDDDEWDTTGYSRQISEIRDWTVQPHELSNLDDVLLLTPYGFCRVEKFRIYREEMKSMLFATPDVIYVEGISTAIPEGEDSQAIPHVISLPAKATTNISKKNEGATIMSIEERSANADKRIRAAEQQRRQKEWKEREAQERKSHRRHYMIGELVARYFPTVQEYEPGTDEENRTRFEPLEAFLYVLSTDPDLVDELRDRAAQLVLDDPDGEWRISV